MINWQIQHFKVVTSTNSLLKNLLLDDDVYEGMVVLADSQTDGRGQRTNKWFSEKEKGLYFSYLLNPNVSLSQIPDFTLFIGELLKNFLSDYFPGITFRVKPPNDIMVDDKKICGILTESVSIGNTLKGIIVGIGINLNYEKNDFPKDLQEKATSIYMLTGNKVTNFKEILMDWLNYFSLKYESYQEKLYEVS